MAFMALDSKEVATYIWRNGETMPWEEATIHVNSVGNASIAGIFEGIRAYWNETDEQLYVFRLQDHMERFLNSIRVVRYGFVYSADELCESVLELLRVNEYRRDVYIRPYVFQKGIVHRLLQAVPGKETELIIDSWPFTSYPDHAIDVCVSSWTRIADNALPARLKCFSNYHNGRLAAMEANVNGYDWPILLDGQGKVTEGPGACLAIVRDGKVVTPSITSSILESVTRDTVGRIVTEVLDIPFEERVIDRTELYICDELFFIGTGLEIMPVASVDRLPVGDGKVGPIGRAIRKAYGEIVRGIDTRYPQWRTPVWL